MISIWWSAWNCATSRGPAVTADRPLVLETACRRAAGQEQYFWQLFSQTAGKSGLNCKHHLPIYHKEVSSGFRNKERKTLYKNYKGGKTPQKGYIGTSGLNRKITQKSGFRREKCMTEKDMWERGLGGPSAHCTQEARVRALALCSLSTERGGSLSTAGHDPRSPPKFYDFFLTKQAVRFL